MEFKTIVGAFDALKLKQHLGLDNVGQETEITTKVRFKHIQNLEEIGKYHYIEISMEI